MDNNNNEDLNKSIQDDKSEAITIHLPRQLTYETEDLEPNYIDVSSQLNNLNASKNAIVVDKNNSEKLEKLSSISPLSTPEYTHLVIKNETNPREEFIVDRYPKQFLQTPQNIKFFDNKFIENESNNLSSHQHNDENDYNAYQRIPGGKLIKGKSYSNKIITPRPSNVQSAHHDHEEDLKHFMEHLKKKNENQLTNSDNSLNELNFRKRNLLVERRFAIRRTIQNSRGLMSITAPVNESERSSNFVFAVANDQVSQHIGYASDLETIRDVIYSPEFFATASKNELCARVSKKKPRNNASAKTKSDSNHSTVTFLYKDKKLFSNDDIFNYNKTEIFDPTGPGPASYYVPRRPPNEKVSPSYTIAKRCLVEKKGGGRTSWEKEYYNSNNPYLKKTDFKRDKKWPTPHDYVKKPSLGDKNQMTWYQYPTYTIGSRANTGTESKQDQLPNINNNQLNQALNKQQFQQFQQLNQPAPDNSISNSIDFNEKIYEFIVKPKKNVRKASFKDEEPQPYFREHKQKITIKSRQNGTQLWNKPEETPGPGAHDHTKFISVKPTKPGFKITHSYQNVNYTGGPFAVN